MFLHILVNRMHILEFFILHKSSPCYYTYNYFLVNLCGKQENQLLK